MLSEKFDSDSLIGDTAIAFQIFGNFLTLTKGDHVGGAGEVGERWGRN